MNRIGTHREQWQILGHACIVPSPCTIPGGHNGLSGLLSVQGKPVFVEGLWRPSESKQQVTPGRGSHGQRFMEESLVPDVCKIIQLVRHDPRSDNAPIYSHTGR